MSAKRSASPAARKETSKEENNDKTASEVQSRSTFVVPSRPDGLRASLLNSYALLAIGVISFVLIGQSLLEAVPQGKFRLKDGPFIDIAEFNASDLGPYPKCHPHYEEHQVVAENGSVAWTKNKDAPQKGPFPPGHPENPEWLGISDERRKAENQANRFRWKGLQPNIHLLFLATLCVMIGSRHAVWQFTQPPEARPVTQSIQKEDAYWFPIVASGMLLGLFLLLKYLGNEIIRTLLTCWICAICTIGIGKNCESIFEIVRLKTTRPLLKIPFIGEQVRLLEILGSCVGVAMAAGYVCSKHWIINNVFGVSFCLLGIRSIGLASIKVGAIMLVGLFFYDVWWVFGSKSVFGSNVMVTAATGIEAPIKLMFPREMGGCGDLKHSMLGLGDIVVPGIFIAFLAKWDAMKIGEKTSKSFIYLNTVMVAYILSLITTVGVMLFFNAAQPALLYIVPYVLVATAGVAILRGELKALWQFEIPDETPGYSSKAGGEDKKDQ